MDLTAVWPYDIHTVPLETVAQLWSFQDYFCRIDCCSEVNYYSSWSIISGSLRSEFTHIAYSQRRGKQTIYFKTEQNCSCSKNERSSINRSFEKKSIFIPASLNTRGLFTCQISHDAHWLVSVALITNRRSAFHFLSPTEMSFNPIENDDRKFEIYRTTLASPFRKQLFVNITMTTSIISYWAKCYERFLVLYAWVRRPEASLSCSFNGKYKR